MLKNVHCSQQTTIPIFVSMELSRSKWLTTSVLPENGEKMSRHCIAAGNLGELFALFTKLRERSNGKTGRSKRLFGKSAAGSCHRGIDVIQALDVDTTEPGADGPDCEEDEVVSQRSDR